MVQIFGMENELGVSFISRKAWWHVKNIIA